MQTGERQTLLQIMFKNESQSDTTVKHTRLFNIMAFGECFQTFLCHGWLLLNDRTHFPVLVLRNLRRADPRLLRSICRNVCRFWQEAICYCLLILAPFKMDTVASKNINSIPIHGDHQQSLFRRRIRREGGSLRTSFD